MENKFRFELFKSLKLNNKIKFDQNATNLLHFKDELKEVISIINNSEPVFIKCIKPNEKLDRNANLFSSHLVLRQIRASGMIEYAHKGKFSKDLNVKLDFQEFVKHYQHLAKASGIIIRGLSPKEVCSKIMQNFCFSSFRLGAREIFLKHKQKDALDKKLDKDAQPTSEVGLDANEINDTANHQNIEDNQNETVGANELNLEANGIENTLNHQNIEGNPNEAVVANELNLEANGIDADQGMLKLERLNPECKKIKSLTKVIFSFFKKNLPNIV